MKFAFAAVIGCILAASTVAHVTLLPKYAPVGRAQLSFTVPHDCGDETIGTSNFTVVLPKGVTGAKVEQVPDWTTSLHMRKDDGGEDEVAAVSWLGMLPDYHYQQFGLRIKLDETMVPGTILYFKAYQECHGDGIRAWDQIPKKMGRYLDSPAPLLVVVPE